MKVHQIPFQNTGYFSNLICDYLEQNERISEFYGNFPNIEGFKDQIKEKSNFEQQKREILVPVLKKQYSNFNLSEKSAKNIDLLKSKNTFTITTGHQLNIFTGPLYFLYKIVSTINLSKKLKKEFPEYNFVPVYWMATEDHDFEEINFFNFKGRKLQWNSKSSGAVGRLKTKGLDEINNEFSKLLGTSNNAKKLIELFENAYGKHSNLTEATRYLVNELFGEYGLVIIDGDDPELKKQFIPIVKNELLENTSFKIVSETNKKLELNYKIQVNPREINLFYLQDDLRERIIYKDDKFIINNTTIEFSKGEILKEIEIHPERFSPNVILRPIYQETILPNLCYIGGGGELAYWMQLKNYFKAVNVVFPILLLRNSVLLISEKQKVKLGKLHISIEEIFNNQVKLINKKVKEISKINIDFSPQKEHLRKQFNDLKELAKQTDVTFLNAVNAQEKKQLKGLETLEKRLLKAQKRKLKNVVNRITLIQDQLFPNQSLEERTRNFSEYYLEFGEAFIPMLFEALEPLDHRFSVIEY